MTMEALSLTGPIGTEVRGVDLSAPMTDGDFRRLRALLADRGVLVFRDQRLERPQAVSFCERFGTLQRHVLNQWLADDCPEVMVLSNLATGDPGRASDAERTARFWHSDLSFMKIPAMATALYALAVPTQGGDTEFADMCAALDAMPAALRDRLTGASAIHDLDHCQQHVHQAPLTDAQRKAAPPVAHPVIRSHPPSGRAAIYISPLHTSHIVGVPADESRALMDEVCAFVTQPRFVYVHRWQSGDFVIWDNRRTLHRGTPYDERERRLLWRLTVDGDAPPMAARSESVHGAA